MLVYIFLTGFEENLHFVNCILGLLVRRQQFGYKGLWQNAFCQRHQSIFFVILFDVLYIITFHVIYRFDYRMILEMSVIYKLPPKL